jgi:integrase
MTANLILFPQPTKKGYPIKIRIIENRKSHYINLKFYIPVAHKDRFWNSKKNELRKNYEHYEAVQEEYAEQLKLRGLMNDEGIMSDEGVTTDDSFIKYFQAFIDTLEFKKQYGMKQKCRSVINHVKYYVDSIGKNDLKFSDIDIDFLNSFQLYLIKKDIAPISQKGYFEKIRRILNKAIVEDKYNPRRHPFSAFEFGKIHTHTKCLEKDEFEYLKDFRPKSLVAKQTQSKFIFQYYAYGMRVSDLLLIKWSSIYEKGSRLKFEMFKTKHMLDISINVALLNILFELAGEIEINNLRRQYKWHTKTPQVEPFYDHIRRTLNHLSTDPKTKDKRIFSDLNGYVDKELYSKLQYASSKYNRDLKTLSKELNEPTKQFDFYLTSHIARHTFAV